MLLSGTVLAQHVQGPRFNPYLVPQKNLYVYNWILKNILRITLCSAPETWSDFGDIPPPLERKMVRKEVFLVLEAAV